MKLEYIQIIITGSTLIGGLLGYLVKFALDKNREAYSENNKIKREIYKKFTSMVFDLFNNEISQEKKNAELKTKLYEFYKDYVLYASPAVINAYGDYMQYLYKNSENIEPKRSMYELSKLIGAMRHELGLSNRKLGRKGINIFRVFFKDFDEIKNSK